MMIRLQSSVVLFALLCFVTLAMTQNSGKVVVVGAGLSGYSAAAKLMENGLNDIVVLEAEGRIGGRILTVPYRDGFIDMGAQWVHGQGKHVIYEMVNKHFKFGDTGFDGTDQDFLVSNGQKINQHQCEKLSKLSEKISDSDSAEAFNGSFGDFFTTQWKHNLKSTTYSGIPVQTSNQMLEYIHRDTNALFASPTWFDISARLNALSEDTDGNQHLTWKTSGFKTVFDYLSKKLPDPSKHLDVESKVQLNKEVTNVKWNPDSQTEKVTVTCADGSTYTADHVIFTASLGVLKARHQTLFTPKLPDKKVKAIQNFGYGTVAKIYLEFEKPFWPTDVKDFVSYALLWNDDDLKAIKGTDKEWLIDIPEFIRVDSYPNLLETLLSGRHTDQVENFDDAKVTNDVMWLLEKFMQKPLPRPISIKRSRWLGNKNFLGTYSYPSMAAQQNNVSTKDLGQSLLSSGGKPVILFAGEATDELFYSTTNAAVRSGWKAASEIAAYLRQN